jgi:hypothetical protein
LLTNKKKALAESVYNAPAVLPPLLLLLLLAAAGALQGGTSSLARCPKRNCGKQDVRLGPKVGGGFAAGRLRCAACVHLG